MNDGEGVGQGIAVIRRFSGLWQNDFAVPNRDTGQRGVGRVEGEATQTDYGAARDGHENHLKWIHLRLHLILPVPKYQAELLKLLFT